MQNVIIVLKKMYRVKNMKSCHVSVANTLMSLEEILTNSQLRPLILNYIRYNFNTELEPIEKGW